MRAFLNVISEKVNAEKTKIRTRWANSTFDADNLFTIRNFFKLDDKQTAMNIWQTWRYDGDCYKVGVVVEKILFSQCNAYSFGVLLIPK